MDNIEEIDPALIRAKRMLADKIHTPQYLFRLWRFMPTSTLDQPYVEVYNPWYFGLEDLTQ